jgi:hypothetical protein
MKRTLMCFIVFSSIALGQNPRGASFAPLAAVTHYVLDGQSTTGPTFGLQYFTREISSGRFSLFGGVTLHSNGYEYYRSDPFIYTEPSQPYRMMPPIYNGAVRVSRFSLGLAFFGFDWRTYLADGSVRPYLGVGAQLVGWSYSSTYTGTILPELKAGLDMRLTSGFAAFAEGQYSFGMPTLFGSRFSTLKELFSFGVGISFAPQW